MLFNLGVRSSQATLVKPRWSNQGQGEDKAVKGNPGHTSPAVLVETRPEKADLSLAG